MRPSQGLSLQNPSKPQLKRQTSQERAEKFSILQAEYIDQGIPSPIVYKAENIKQLNSLANKYEQIEKYKGLGGNNDYYLDNIDNFTLQQLKAIV